jgi:hypothetical protein
MAAVKATIVIDQADDLNVRFSASNTRESVELDFLWRTAPVATLAFQSERNTAERFALWLEDAAALIRSEASLLEQDIQTDAAAEARVDAFIWGEK